MLRNRVVRIYTSDDIYPMTFEPVYKDYVWGGNKLCEFGKTLPNGKVAESWEASCHPQGVSLIGNGLLKWKSLSDVIEEYGASIIGTRIAHNGKYPLLVKFIDASAKLSVQVHPPDEYAQKYENGESGKNEMWYIISAEPDAYIYYGITEGITKQEFSRAVKNGTVEKYLNKMYVYPGDAINIPAGTVHAICEGITLIEVQQNSDTTYRIFDYNRVNSEGKPLRELHVKKALDVIDFNKNHKKKLNGIKLNLGTQGFRNILAANKYFACELWNTSGTLFLESDPQKFSIYTLIDGSLTIHYKNGSTTVTKGESVMIPSSLGKHIFEGRFIAIKSYMPDLEHDIYAPLMDAGFDKKYIQECTS